MSTQVDEKTSADTIHCLCDHLTAFGGQLFVAPNPIDFDKVFTELANLPETGNVAVIIAVGCAFALYLLLLLWARRADKRDAMKVGTESCRRRNKKNKRSIQLDSSTNPLFKVIQVTVSVYKTTVRY